MKQVFFVILSQRNCETIDAWFKELNKTVTNHATAEEEDYEMPYAANDGENTDDIEPQKVTSNEHKGLLEQLVRD